MTEIHFAMVSKSLLAFFRFCLLPLSSFFIFSYLTYNVFSYNNMLFNSGFLTFFFIGFFLVFFLLSLVFGLMRTYSSFFIAKNFYINKNEITFNIDYFKYIPFKSFILVSIDKQYDNGLTGYSKSNINEMFDVSLRDKNNNIIEHKVVDVFKGFKDDVFFTLKPVKFIDKFKVKNIRIESEKHCIINVKLFC